MQTITVQINSAKAVNALEALAAQKLVTIIDKTDFDSATLAGDPMSIDEFKTWVAKAENAPALLLDEAKKILRGIK